MDNRQGAGVELEAFACGEVFLGDAEVPVPGDVDFVTFRGEGGHVGAHGDVARALVEVGVEEADDFAGVGLEVVLDKGGAVAVGTSVGARDVIEVAAGLGAKVEAGDVVVGGNSRLA